MKKYLSNNWSTGLTIIGIILLTFLFGIGIMTTPVVNYTYSIFDLGTKFSYNQDTILIFSLVIIIIFFLTLLPLALAILSLFKKKSGGMLALIFYQLAFQIIIITYQSLYQVVTPGIMAYAIINIILVIASFTLYIL